MSLKPSGNSIMETNLSGTLRACRMFGRRHMIANRYGRIVNIASDFFARVPFRSRRLQPQARPMSRPSQNRWPSMGDVRDLCQRSCSRRVSHGSHAALLAERSVPRVSDANAYAQVGNLEELVVRGLPGFRCRKLRHRRVSSSDGGI